jgi:hypothetical protein
MNNDTIILSMTTWPPRFAGAIMAMQILLYQRQESGLENRVHPVLVLSEDEISESKNRREACTLMQKMEEMGVETIIDKGNIRSHKKLIPTLEKYPHNPILCVDDDNAQAPGWLRTFVSDHDAHPTDIIYAQGCSRISVQDGRIIETRDDFCMFLTKRGQVTTDIKPGSGAILYPPHTFTDKRFFDRDLFMHLCPSDDETWQWAFAKIAMTTPFSASDVSAVAIPSVAIPTATRSVCCVGNATKTTTATVRGGSPSHTPTAYRLLSACNIPSSLGARQDVALWNTNKTIYTKTHNAIAAAIPEYLEALKQAATH